ncbi:MAG: glycosyltransferase [Alphaproteobacteria bacterium]
MHDVQRFTVAPAELRAPVVTPQQLRLHCDDPAEQHPIGVLVKVFPKLSETFILNEVLDLEDRGLALRIFVLSERREEEAHAAAARVRAPIFHIRAHRALGAWLRCFTAAPGRFVTGLARALWWKGPAGSGCFAEAVQLAALMRRQRVRRLHAHFIDRTADVAALAAHLCGVPFNISAHAKDIYLSADRAVRRRIRAAEFTVTCTEHNRQHLHALAGGEARIERIYHGINVDQFRPHAVDAGRCEDPPVLLAVGRLREKKGFSVLIEACRLLRDQGVDFRCRIVGYGPEQERLQAQIAAAALGGCVALVGRQTHQTIIEEYRRASVFVLPCRITADGDRDGVPNTILEAMAMELPVVCSDVSGVPEAVRDGETGVLVAADDAAALAAAIHSLLADPQERRRLGAAARRSVCAQFDGTRNLEPLLRLFAADGAPAVPNDGMRVAYILMGYPRLSETFISNEIHLLESLGLDIRLFSVKRGEDERVNGVIERIRAEPSYLPRTTSVSQTPLTRWLWQNLPRYAGSHWRILRRAPRAYVGALGMAVAMSWRYRPPGFLRLKKVFLKEFFQAGWIADEVMAAGGIRHLHGHFCHGVTTIAWFASRMTGLPFSFTAHAKDIYRGDQNPGDLLQRKLKATRFVATCTAANAEYLRGLTDEPEKVHTIYHGLDIDYFAPRDRASCIGEPLILAVGRFVDKKGFDDLIDACAELRRRGTPFRCRIVGERGDARDDCKDRIADQVRRLGLTDVVDLTDAVTQDELKEVYRHAAVFVLPCRVAEDGDRDGIPNVLAEAMAMGVPVVSTRISGIPEIVDDGVDGLLVPERDPGALAEAIGRVLDQPALGSALGVASRDKICDCFDSRETTQALKALFVQQIALAVRAP